MLREGVTGIQAASGASILRSAPAFQSVPLPELERLAARCTLQRFRRGAHVMRRGAPGESLLVVGRGRLKATLASPTADGEFLCGMFWPGDTFGELSIFGPRQRPVSATALTDCEILFVPREHLLALLERRPAVIVRLIEQLCDRLRNTIDMNMGLRYLDLHTRLYQRLLLLSRHDTHVETGGIRIQHGLSQQELADSIGASREGLNKLLSEWKKAGLIETGRGYTTVLDPAGLASRVALSARKDFLLDREITTPTSLRA